MDRWKTAEHKIVIFIQSRTPQIGLLKRKGLSPERDLVYSQQQSSTKQRPKKCCHERNNCKPSLPVSSATWIVLRRRTHDQIDEITPPEWLTCGLKLCFLFVCFPFFLQFLPSSIILDLRSKFLFFLFSLYFFTITVSRQIVLLWKSFSAYLSVWWCIHSFRAKLRKRAGF